jgi:hypothetical protein
MRRGEEELEREENGEQQLVEQQLGFIEQGAPEPMIIDED